jgi:hypothetical protein
MRPRTLCCLALADLLERARRKGFFVAVLAMVVLATLYLPAREASYLTLSVGGDVRGAYDSEWLGTVVAVLGALVFSLPAFYLVKDAVERDERTRFGEVLAGTPATRLEYVLGKTLSNFCYLAALTATVALAAAAIQLVRGESHLVNPVSLLLPTVVVVWPAMLLVSAIAVLFGCLPLLREGLGSVAYFVLYVVVFLNLAVGEEAGPAVLDPVPDPLGVREPLAAMTRAAMVATGVEPGVFIGVNPAPSDLATFDFVGVPWDPAAIGWRLLWCGVVLLIAALAAPFFSRFDPARAEAVSLVALLPGRFRGRLRGRPAMEDATGTPADLPARASLTALPDRAGRWRFTSLVPGELRLALKGRGWWYAGALGLVVAGLMVPPEAARGAVLPLAWLWPLLLWSPLGSREERHGTAEIVFSARGARARQPVAAFAAGVLVALLVAGGVGANLALSGHWGGLLALFAGALFVPALAVASGTLSGGSALFEGLYLALWYVGPFQKGVPALDFAGSSGFAGGRPLAYLLVAIVLLAVALTARRSA